MERKFNHISIEVTKERKRLKEWRPSDEFLK